MAAACQGQELVDLSLQELMNLRVTSVARKDQSLHDAAAAVFVITGEDIRRSGVTSIPEALRMAPGIEVARIGGNTWAISSRGFNGRFASKLLVLIDGRSVYTPLFSGVAWDAQDTLLEDIDRIEVIRGPGAALWGANAVNGVVNIITRKAAESQGDLVAANAGTYERRGVALRHGASLDGHTQYRLHAKARARGDMAAANGGHAGDSSDTRRAGARIEREEGPDRYRLQGEVFESRGNESLFSADLSQPLGQVLLVDNLTRGGHLLARWERSLGAGSELHVQAYLDHGRMEVANTGETRDTADVEFQHRFQPHADHELTWGAGHRHTRDRAIPSPMFTPDPVRSHTGLTSVFVQDEIRLADGVQATLGNRSERSGYTGWEHQPNVRLRWSPDEDSTWWVVASRAVRTPSRMERDVHYTGGVLPAGTPGNPGPLPAMFDVVGNKAFGSERLHALDLGHRVRLSPQVFVDVALFRNRYEDLAAVQPGSPVVNLAPIPHVIAPYTVVNGASAVTRGMEVAADWRVAPQWRLHGVYSYLDMTTSDAPGAISGFGGHAHHRASLRVSTELDGRTDLDLWLRHVGELAAKGIPAWTELDVRLAWRPAPGVEVAVVGQNLLHRRHAEYPSDFTVSPTSYVPRSVYASVRWDF